MTKHKCSPITSILQDKIVPIPDSIKKVEKLRNDDHRRFYFICGLIGSFAESARERQQVAPDHWQKFLNDFSFLKNNIADQYWFNAAIEEIEEVYNKIYGDPTDNIIQFPGAKEAINAN